MERKLKFKRILGVVLAALAALMILLPDRATLIYKVILSGLLPKQSHQKLVKKLMRYLMAGILILEKFGDKETIFRQA